MFSRHFTLELLKFTLYWSCTEECGSVDDGGDFLRPTCSPQASTLRPLMSECSLVQMIVGPTRVTQSSELQIDLLFSTDAELLRSVGCEDPGLSDHSLIFGELDVNRETRKQTVRMIRCFRSCNWDELFGFGTVARDGLNGGHTMSVGFLEEAFWEIVASHIPTKRARVKTTLPWITPDI